MLIPDELQSWNSDACMDRGIKYALHVSLNKRCKIQLEYLALCCLVFCRGSRHGFLSLRLLI